MAIGLYDPSSADSPTRLMRRLHLLALFAASALLMTGNYWLLRDRPLSDAVPRGIGLALLSMAMPHLVRLVQYLIRKAGEE